MLEGNPKGAGKALIDDPQALGSSWLVRISEKAMTAWWRPRAVLHRACLRWAVACAGQLTAC